jgi:hypothetical protein
LAEESLRRVQIRCSTGVEKRDWNIHSCPCQRGQANRRSVWCQGQ